MRLLPHAARAAALVLSASSTVPAKAPISHPPICSAQKRRSRSTSSTKPIWKRWPGCPAPN